MRYVVLILAIAVVFVSASESERTAAEYLKLFTSFVAKFRRAYKASAFAAKLKTFTANLLSIDALNKAAKSTKYGVTQFADLTEAEFAKTYLMAPGLADRTGTSLVEEEALSAEEEAALLATLPESYDLRDHAFDVLGRPKMQGSCGSCWSFGSTSSVESAYALASKSTPPLLSEQQLLDCAGWSCSGGRPSSALSFMAREKKGGVALASAYPYVAKQGKCLQDDAKSYGRVTKFSSIKGNDAALMQAILSYGSVTASVNARPLQLYSSGILTFEACKGFMADHVVNVVGWGSEVIAGKKSDYWIMRNSWSDAWGESAGRHYPGKLGYYRIERNGSNSCKIHSNLLAVESVAKL